MNFLNGTVQTVDDFTLKPPKPVDLHTIDNFLKELKSYSLVLFPGTAATDINEKKYATRFPVNQKWLQGRIPCSRSSYHYRFT